MSFYGTRIFPLFMDLGMKSRTFSIYRRELLYGVSGTILEIGVGTGLNFRFYPQEITRIVTADPNPGMHKKAQKRATKHRLEVEHHQVSAETLPFADNTFDVVISTWTLCSIPDLPKALSEIRRVLKPGGNFRYVEHGLAPEADVSVRMWQHRCTPVQRVIADGCHLNRSISHIVEEAGFTHSWQRSGYAQGTPKMAGYMYQGVTSPNK